MSKATVTVLPVEPIKTRLCPACALVFRQAWLVEKGATKFPNPECGAPVKEFVPC